MITEEQKQKYLSGSGSVCPFCSSTNLSGGEFDMGNGQVWQNIVCNGCKKEWSDIYTLTSIEEFEEDTEHFCPKCHQQWAVHDSDGSCIEA